MTRCRVVAKQCNKGRLQLLRMLKLTRVVEVVTGVPPVEWRLRFQRMTRWQRRQRACTTHDSIPHFPPAALGPLPLPCSACSGDTSGNSEDFQSLNSACSRRPRKPEAYSWHCGEIPRREVKTNVAALETTACM